MTSLQRINLDPLIDGIRRRMAKANYIPCPACGQKWTSLFMCPFFWYDKAFRRDDVTYLCMECAQTPKGFDFIVEQWPIEKPNRNWCDSWIQISAFWPNGMPHFDEVDGIDTDEKTGDAIAVKVKLFRWGELRVRIRAWLGGNILGAPAFEGYLNAGSEKITFWDCHTQTRVSFPNAVAAWFSIKAKIHQQYNDQMQPQDLPALPAPRRAGGFRKMK